jgi:ADP-heptose:LPS heptosyltransferase
MNIILEVSGGLGKSFMSTAVVKALRKQYTRDNIIVVTSYPDVFKGNNNVNRIITHANAGPIYRDFINNKEAKVFITDPYTTSDFITEKKHLIEIWCDLCGVPYNGELPELFISKSERQYYEQFYKLDKPIMAIHPNGGSIEQPLKYSWTRDIPQPIIENIIEHYKDDYSVVHIRREDQFQYDNTISALDNFRSIAIMLTLSEKRLLIDSSAMHIASSLGLPSTVAWIGTNPKVFGYNIHDNIIANPHTEKHDISNNYYQKYMLFEDISRIPYSDMNDIFNISDIIDSINKQ